MTRAQVSFAARAFGRLGAKFEMAVAYIEQTRRLLLAEAPINSNSDLFVCLFWFGLVG